MSSSRRKEKSVSQPRWKPITSITKVRRKFCCTKVGQERYKKQNKMSDRKYKKQARKMRSRQRSLSCKGHL